MPIKMGRCGHPIYIRYAQWLKSELTEEEMILFIKELQHVDK